VIIQPLDCPDWAASIAQWHHQHCLQRGIRSSLEKRTAQLQAHLDSKTIPVTLTARRGERLAGCVSLVRYRASGDGAAERVWLSNLFVPERERRSGVGSSLLNQAADYARALGLESLWLFTDEWEAFYRRRGWQPAGDARVSGSDVTILSLPLM